MPLRGYGGYDNWNLSVDRALSTFRTLLRAAPDLQGFQNERKQPILSVSGYGEQRPAVPNNTEESPRSKNCRIDLRFIMSTPQPIDLSEGTLRTMQQSGQTP